LWIEFNPELVVPLSLCFVRNQKEEAAYPKADTSSSTPEGDTGALNEKKKQTTSSPLWNLFKRKGNFFKTRQTSNTNVRK
jgi:hypothetical protein